MSFIHIICNLNYTRQTHIIITVIDLWEYLKSANKPIVLYGMGNGADKIIAVLDSFGIKYSGVFATDGFVRDKYFHGFKLASYSELKEKFGDMIVLVCFGSARPEVMENIKRIASEQELYAPDVPVYGDGLFTKEYAESRRTELEYVYGRLTDNKSKQTFLNVIKYKITGKPDYLFCCETDTDEPYNSFLKLSDSEHFLDLGAYNGDTVSDFIKRTSDYGSITAVEPDPKNFKKLTRFAEGKEKIRLINACISDKCGSKGFSAHGGRNSSAGGDKSVCSVTIDSLTENTPVSYIKMDIEGSEREAVKGAESTIKNYKPKMLISCYHRTEDLFALPIEVDKIRNDYKLYLRHFPSVPAWELNYYFI